MRELVIKKIESFIYTLQDKNGKEYMLELEFHDLNEKPNINDNIFIDDNLLKENILLAFGPIGSKYGKEINILEENEIIKLIINGDTIYLQRYYG